MLNFHKPSSGPESFTLDRAEHVRARRRTLQRREWRVLLLMPVALVVVIWTWYKLVDPLQELRNRVPPAVVTPVELRAMPQPLLEQAEPLANSEQIAAYDPAVMVESDPPRVVSGLDAQSLAWARAVIKADRAAAPIPQRFVARDLLFGNVRVGSPAVVTGRIVDAREEDRSPQGVWTRIVLAADEGQFYHVVVPDLSTPVDIGSLVHVVGRTMGSLEFPCLSGTTAAAATAAVTAPTSATIALPLMVGRALHRVKRTVVDEDATDPMQAYRGFVPVTLPASMWEGVSDERSILETRPYYMLIGQAVTDSPATLSATESLPQFNREAFHIHRNPEEWRGKLMRFSATVYQSWEDPDIARDKPYGAQRGYRILAWTEDFSTVIARDENTGATTASFAPVLRLVEFVGVNNQPLPVRGQRIEGVGRYFKFRGIKAEINQLADKINNVRRQSDMVYMSVIVGKGYSLQPDSPPMTTKELVWSILVFVVCCGFAVAMVLAVRSDNRKQAAFVGKIKNLRDQRRALAKSKTDHAGNPATPSAEASSPPTPSTPPAPPAG